MCYNFIVKSLQRTIEILFYILFFLVPLILWPFNSELFEFNKIITVYILVICIVAVWTVKMIWQRKFIFRRTILDIPLLLFFGSQVLSTLFSIDPYTSLFGYYSRFNGGLLSTISYLLLYWAFVSNIQGVKVKKIINITFLSAALVSIYGVLEHWGIDKNIWQQDVQSRVFSTLGQPNWLAAWLVALIPVTWSYILDGKNEKLSLKTAVPYILSTLFFIVLLFTKSRSGLIGFMAAEIIFWGVIFLKYKSKSIKNFLTINIFIAIAALIFGTQFTPNIVDLFKKVQLKQTAAEMQTGATVLETGGTESGTIRKIVWKGAIDIWKHYPVFGTGVETFAYSYYLYRPTEHNLTSEWDYIYNKAHNEYLNHLANAGFVGLLTYLAVIGFSIYLMITIPNKYQYQINTNAKSEKLEIDNWKLIIAGLLSGYISILITNFFGFSVVPVQILFYLYPALTVVIYLTENDQTKGKIFLTANQKTFSWIIAFFALFLFILTCRYWYADTLYAKGASYNKVNRQDIATDYLNKAIKLQPRQSIYYSELSKSYVNLALAYNEAEESTTAAKFAKIAIDNSIKSVNLTPANVNLKRIEFGVFVMLSSIDINYLLDAKDILVTAVEQAPTDAKLHYNLGLIYSRIGENKPALQLLNEAVELKPNYKEARLAYAILLIDADYYNEAKTQLEYILTNLDPNDSIAKQYLESVK